MTAEPAEDGTRYRLLDTIRQYAADRLADAGETEAAQRRHALAFLNLANREQDPDVLSRDRDNFRAALEWSLSRKNEMGPRLALALGKFWLNRGFLQEGRNWLERTLTQPSIEQRLRADLLRLLGAVLYEAGELARAEAVLSEGSQVAAAVGATAVQARIRVLLADIHTSQGARHAEMLAECEAAAAVLTSEGDLEGLADAWVSAGRLHFWVDDPAAEEVLERAIACARRSGNRRAQMRASHWLAVTFYVLPIPVDAGIARAEQLLHEAGRDPWAEGDLLKPLSVLYAYVGRAADARAAIARTRSIFTRFGAKLALAEAAIPAALLELALGDLAAAERYLREGYQAFQVMGERGYAGNLAAMLADVLYTQDRLNEAQQMTEQAQAFAIADETGPRANWRSTRAKLLARRGQAHAAHQLMAEVEAFLGPTATALDRATTLVAKAEVNRLTGAPGQAATDLRAALQIYQDRRATSLAEQVKATLADLIADSDNEPA